MEKLTIRSIDRKDLNKASEFAAQGMNFRAIQKILLHFISIVSMHLQAH